MCTPQSIIEQWGCRAFDEAVNAASKAGKYVLQYRTNLDKLRTEMRSLEDRRVIIERKVSEANDRGEEIENAVSHWQADADEMKNYVQDLIERSTAEAKMHCFACSCPNIKGRYRLSKQAEEKIADVKKLAQESHFDEISHPKPPPPELEFPSAQNYFHFDSRTPIFEDIVGALKDPNVKMVGIYGLGGVGKTTLVEKVAKKMLDDGTFKQVPLVAVSKDLNVKDIQKKLADKLNLELKATADENAIAIQLWNKFKNGKKLYLVILDDIWEKVDLKAIGIPIADGTTGCKVVLTSRNKDLLRITMKADINFQIAELSEAEAWDLFKKKVGNTIESRPEIDSLARQVCRKCKGLPVAINALGAALEEKQVHVWNDALKKLERYMITNIEGINQTVWASLKLSYDMLGSSDAKSCFLLCCLFLEDAEISIGDLTRHCVANSLLSQNPYTLDEARNAVRTVVDALKSASLLSTVVDALKSDSLLSTDYHENVVKIHDVIRDVGISIAREEKSFLIDHGAHEWPRNSRNVTSYSAISLSFKSIKGLPNGLEYPQLHTLMVDNSELSDLEVPDNFFNGMIQLTVVTFTRMRMRRLPTSLAKLAKLQMLYLNECEFDDISILKELKSSLEVLSLRGSRIEALPLEIRQLTGLRVLDLQDCDELKVIPRGVISKLISLEELYFPENFDIWEATTDEEQDTSNRKNVSLEELRGLLSADRLTTLRIHIPNVRLLSTEGLMFANLKGFNISLGSQFGYSEKLISGRCVLKLDGIQLRNEFIPLVDKADVVFLSYIKCLKKVFHDRSVGNRFLDLKYLKVRSCDHLKYLFVEPIQGLHRLPPFNNLIVLIIEKYKSKYLFSPTIAKGLVHLEKLEVKYCEIMEGIVGLERRNDEDEINSEVKFNKLKQLELVDLPNLLSFYAQKEKMGTTMGSSSACAQPLFSEKVIFPVLESLTIERLDNIIAIWDKQSIAILQEQGSFCQLTNLRVRDCSKLMHVFSSNMHPLLKNLEKLEVKSCGTMKGIAEFEGERDEDGHRNEVVASLALEVEHLETVGVPKIKEIRDKQPLPEPKKEVESLCKLMDIRIEKCGQLLYVFPSHMLPQNLQELWIKDCDELKVILSKDLKEEKEAINDDIIVFPRLKRVSLWTLRKLKSFYTETQGFFFSHKVIFPVLKKLSIQRVHQIIEIWDKQSIAVLEEQGSFCQLTDLDVSKCEKLMHVFPSKMHSPLKNLKVLCVSDCPTMERIVEFEGEIDEDGLRNEVCFSELSSLELSSLPNLESFCTKSGKADTTEGNSNIHALPLFNGKVVFPVLKRMHFRNLDKITRIWDDQPLSKPEKEAKSFSELDDITVHRCDQLEYILPFYMLPQLKNLQQLSINNCTKVEVIISNNPKEKEATNNNDTIRFPQLKTLTLSSLPNFKSFIWSDETQAIFSNKVQIKVVFPVLERFNLTNLDKITRIWNDQPLSKPEKEAKSFSELEGITVHRCDQLEYVLPSYMLPQLKNLKKLDIRSCTKVEVIISNNPKEKEATNNNDTIRFPQLKTLTLSSLPNFKSFIWSDETQSIFSNKVQIKVAFPVLERLLLGKLDNITRIWDNQPLLEPEKKAKSFCKLMVIIVVGCEDLEYALPFYMLPQLKNLEELRIQSCRKMEVIISNNPKGKEDTNNNDTIWFPQLKTLNLGWLPNLKSFICSETQLFFSNKIQIKDAFPVLESISIEDLKSPTKKGHEEDLLVFSTRRSILLRHFKNPMEKVSVEDAFPVLIQLILDEDSEILRDGTYTKKECSTSGKKSDPNGEELDEDLETPTKEISMEECSTSGEESDHNGEELDEDLETPTKEVVLEAN
ncbi:hypothetical protein RHMOL_Rhmol03G0013800 [Rhododendron molle]|uniref:Uncharacterized protein n=1 Tax=Rhododendron molle TaxID=49168 RepID=A0ACC0PAE4_RHOML|nr:hypothetical protein RHMOL_Rhmol03G0013800 [Rhododendron molle]